MNVLIKKESKDEDDDDNDDEMVEEKGKEEPMSVLEKRAENMEKIETLENNDVNFDKIDLNNHNVHALGPKKHDVDMSGDLAPADEGTKWFDKVPTLAVA